MSKISHNYWLLAAMLICVITTGCGSSEDDLHHDDHNEHDDHEHLEHFVPAHKPKDFAELVDQLALRLPQLATTTDGGSESATTSRRELADIIGWIPELAADSELKKSGFESAVATANKLAKILEGTAAGANTKTVDVAVYEPMIKELRQLIPESQFQAEQM